MTETREISTLSDDTFIYGLPETAGAANEATLAVQVVQHGRLCSWTIAGSVVRQTSPKTDAHLHLRDLLKEYDHAVLTTLQIF
jgi:hypothetical protein